MRSRDRMFAALVLVVVADCFAVLAVWSLVARSAIPLSWHGTVTAKELRPEKHPGDDDVWYVAIDGKARHVDTPLATRLAVGNRVDKDAWSTTLRIDGEATPLRLSRNAKAMFVVAPLLLAAIAWLALPRRRDE